MPCDDLSQRCAFTGKLCLLSCSMAKEWDVSKVEKERTKLTASFLNSLATASAVAGFVAPLAAYSYGFPNSTGLSSIDLIGLGWLLVE